MEAYNYGISNLYELAEYVQLSEKYIAEILKHYKNKYGIGTHFGEYLITFDPLRVLNIKKYKQRRNLMKTENFKKQWIMWTILVTSLISIGTPGIAIIPFALSIYALYKLIVVKNCRT